MPTTTTTTTTVTCGVRGQSTTTTTTITTTSPDVSVRLAQARHDNVIVVGSPSVGSQSVHGAKEIFTPAATPIPSDMHNGDIMATPATTAATPQESDSSAEAYSLSMSHPDQDALARAVKRERSDLVSAVMEALGQLPELCQGDALADCRHLANLASPLSHQNGANVAEHDQVVNHFIRTISKPDTPLQHLLQAQNQLKRFTDDVDNMCRRTVSITKLVEFTELHDCWNWPTYKVVSEIVQPQTERAGPGGAPCRYVDLSDFSDRTILDVFVSHPWGAKWGTLVSACRHLCRGSRQAEDTFHVWIDIFAILQHAVEDASKGTARDLQLLTVMVTAATSVVLVAEPPNDVELASVGQYFAGNVPALNSSTSRQIPFMRVWCLEELRVAIVNTKPIVMLVGRVDADTHTFVPNKGWKLFRKLIGIVNVDKAEASVESDTKMILDRIRESMGVNLANALIRGAIAGSEYCQEFIEVQAAACGLTSISTEITPANMDAPRGHHKCTVLMACAGAGFGHILRELIKLGANTDFRAKNGKTPIMYACRAGQLDCVRALVDNGCDVNAVDDYGWSGLMDAANWGNMAVVEYLVTVPGIDTALTTTKDSSALDMAVAKGHADIIEILSNATKA